MPEPTKSAANAASRSVDLSDAPGGDMLFEQLFPADEVQTTAPTNATVSGDTSGTQPQATQPAAAPDPAAATPPQEELFLQVPTGTVYKTREEAIKGFAHKDEVIEQLRQRFIAERGIDPITNKQVAPAPAPQPQPTAEVNFANNGAEYVKALTEAYQKQDWDAYARAQSKFLMDTLAPVAPVFMGAAKQQAVSTVEAELKDIRGFLGSNDFSMTLEQNPILKQAIESAESNFAFNGQLPGLYKLAYQANQSRKLPELLAAATASARVQPVQPTRPTTTAATLPPPDAAGPMDLTTSEGRKNLIKQFESQGLDKVTF